MVRRTLLPWGTRIISEKYPVVPSFTLGVWFPVGSTFESSGEEGLTHFIEHLLFRGTKKRTSFELSNEIDKRGGVLNGFTSREFTCFYVKLLKDFLDVGVDVLSDMLINSLFKEDDLERERKVVLHEIDASFDSPEERVFDLFYEGYWDGSSFSHPVLGKREIIEKVTRDDIVSYFERMFGLGSAVVSLSGDVDHEELVEVVGRHWKDGSASHLQAAKPNPVPGIYREERDIEQIHVVIGFEGFSAVDDLRFSLHMASTYLGSGMSSVLFQEVREELAACYTIHSFYQVFRATGLFGIYFATSPNMLSVSIDRIGSILSRLKKHGIPPERLKEVKDQAKGNVVLSQETSDARMGRMARNEFYHGREITIEETLERIDAVTPDDVMEVARSVLSPSKVGVAFLGPLKGLDLEGLFSCLKSRLEG